MFADLDMASTLYSLSLPGLTRQSMANPGMDPRVKPGDDNGAVVPLRKLGSS